MTDPLSRALDIRCLIPNNRQPAAGKGVGAERVVLAFINDKLCKRPAVGEFHVATHVQTLMAA